MWIYVALWLFLLGGWYVSWRAKLNPKYFVFLAFTAMALVLGLRGAGVGEDTKIYLQIAEQADQMSWSAIFSSFPKSEWNFISYGFYGRYSEQIETVFLGYCKLIMSVFHNAQAVLLISAVITNVFIAKFIKDNAHNNADVYFAVFVYMCESLFMTSFNLVRQTLALSIAAQSVACVKKKKYKKAFVYVLVASLIHLSAIVFVAVPIMYVLRNKRMCYLTLIGSGCVIFAVPVLHKIVKVILPRYADYLVVSYWRAQVNGVIVLWTIIIALAVLLLRSKKSVDEDYWLIAIMVLYLAIEIIGLRYTVISRVALYFRLFIGLFLCQAKKVVPIKPKGTYVAVFVFLLSASFLKYAASPARLYYPFWE